MKIRSATKNDIPVLVKIARVASRYSWSERVLQDCLRADYYIWLVESSHGEVLGFIVILYQLEECQLLNICVEPQHQRQGLGYRLLKYSIDFAKKNHAKRFSLEVRSSNEAAKSLYRSFGFIEVGIRKDYYPGNQGREDAHFFVLQL
ncbi:MAG: ribosomal protein S18-alanine N-acetyltransferase [Gammaproteobacteria bacterium]|nr:ribosomal protein S18-alanine N-acetyltransferase [Gammaproteobacteria bacterium]